MKTIVEGNFELLAAFKYFKCSCCGWIGKADKNEYIHDYDRDEDYYSIKCPYCKKTVYSVENNHEIEEIRKIELRNEDYDF